MDFQFEFRKYSDADKSAWDNFVSTCKTQSFLFYRDFVEYHKDRFEDHSLLIYCKEKLVALLPACKQESRLASHGGLTYGGLVTGSKMTGPMMLDLIPQLKSFAKEQGFKEILYKALPHIYHLQPAEEDLYALYHNGGKIIQRHISTAVDYRSQGPVQERRRRGVKKAADLGFTVEESTDFSEFWQALESNLMERHKVKPVHTLEEIHRLHNLFPENVRQFVCRNGGGLGAGVVMFESESCAHVQYIAATPLGKDTAALDFLFDHLIGDYADKKYYFDFGVSTEEQGRVLNRGLIEQKEGFGGRAVTYDIYHMLL